MATFVLRSPPTSVEEWHKFVGQQMGLGSTPSMADLGRADVRSGSRISDAQFLCLRALYPKSTTTDRAKTKLLSAGFFTSVSLIRACAILKDMAAFQNLASLCDQADLAPGPRGTAELGELAPLRLFIRQLLPRAVPSLTQQMEAFTLNEDARDSVDEEEDMEDSTFIYDHDNTHEPVTMSTVETTEKKLTRVAQDELVVLQTNVAFINAMFHTASWPMSPSLEVIASQAAFRVFRPTPNSSQVLYSARVDASVCRYPDLETALEIIEVKRNPGETMKWRKQITAELVAFLATQTRCLEPEARDNYNRPLFLLSQNHNEIRIVHAKYSKEYLQSWYTENPVSRKAFMRIYTYGPWNIHKGDDMK